MRKILNNPWLVCLTAALFFFYQYLQLASFNVLKPEIIRDFAISNTALASLSALYFYGTVLFMVPAGILLDKLSTRTIILLAMALTIFGVTLFMSASNIYYVGIARFIIGVCGGPFCFLGTMRLASRWFPPNRMAFVTGVVVSFAMVGGLIAQTPFVYLLDIYGWRNTVALNAMLGLIIFLMMYMFVKNYPPGKSSEYKEQLEYYKRNGIVKGLKKIMSNPAVWGAGVFASLLNVPIFILGALWGMHYLCETRAIDKTSASLICSLLFVGMLIGAPLFGFISDKIRMRKTPMLIGAVLCLFGLLLVLNPAPISIYYLIFFLIGFGSASQVLAYPMVAELNAPAVTGSAMSLAAVLIMSGGAVFQPIVGYLSDLTYYYVIWLNIVLVMLSIIIVFYLPETRCKQLAKS